MNALLRGLCGLALIMLAFSTQAQVLVEWTEQPGRLGLGYPVPIPVDTPLPFDGFRSYAGLHARHQDLAINHDFIDASIVGQSRLGRDIWAYRLGAGNHLNDEGLPRAALMFNGGIHAREWQSPEAVTGLMERLVAGHDDNYWLEYIIDNTSIVLVPVNNIDGFLQTQRYPRQNWLEIDNRDDHEETPRDGRMRRKNLRDADENLFSTLDLLNGVDLNRNNEPFWPGPEWTDVPEDLTYRGPAAASEPETQALMSAADLAPPEQLRFYADMHSYSSVYFSVRTFNQRLNAIQERVLGMASDHHAALPGGKRYEDIPGTINQGIGTTSEYFAHFMQVPAQTWEIEPSFEPGGAEYGGFGSNSSDGFILPESEIARVRDNLAETMLAVAYHMAGPPRIVRADLLDENGRLTLWSARWRKAEGGKRTLVTRNVRPIEAGQSYQLRLVFSKPMRWRDDGEVAPFPGQTSSALAVDADLLVDDQALAVTLDDTTWSAEPHDWIGLRPQYRDSTLTLLLTVQDTQSNHELLDQATDATARLSVAAADMTGHRLDADPSTPVGFRSGAWHNYDGGADPDQGGADRTLELDATDNGETTTLTVGPGHTAMWFNPDRSGEGWVLEILSNDRALGYWFTFDDEGRPSWLIGDGTVEGNRIEFPELLAGSGARFGSAFDPDDVEFETVGSARMIFTGCENGWYEYEARDHHRTIDFEALTSTWGTICGPMPITVDDRARLSGSWYDPQQPGQGLTLQWMSSESMLLVWFTYDADGRPYWVIGQSEAGSTDPIVFPELLAVRGPVFGDGFDPEDAEQRVWGRAELTLDCGQGLIEYESGLEGFEDGSLPLERLTELAGLTCSY